MVPMTFVEAVGLGIGILAIVVPEWWHDMPRPFKYGLTMLGFALLAWSGIIYLQDFTGMKITSGPLALVIAGLLATGSGAAWHIYLSGNQVLATSGALPAGTKKRAVDRCPHIVKEAEDEKL